MLLPSIYAILVFVHNIVILGCYSKDQTNTGISTNENKFP